MLPWLLGSQVALRLAKNYTHLEGVSAIAIGSGGYAGYLIFAFLIWAADRLQMTLLATELAPVYVILSAMFLVQLVRHVFILAPNSRVPILLALAAGYVSWSVLISGTVPTAGWDVLDYWAKKASHFVDHSSSEFSKPYSFRDSFRHVSRHPLTLNLVHAWHLWATTVVKDVSNLSITPWSLALLSIFLVTSGACIFITKSAAVGIIAGLMTLTMPLLENHALIGGYTEVWVSIGLTSSIAWLLVAKAEDDRTLFLIGIFLSVTIVFLRNTGFVYALIPVSSLALAKVLDWVSKESLYLNRHQFLTLLVSLLAVVFLAAVLILYRVANVDFDIVFAGRVLSLALPDVNHVFMSEFNSKILNQSFSVSFLIVFVAVFSMLFDSSRWTSRSVELIASAQTIGFMLLLLSLFTDHGLRHALPGSDTGHSRFSIPVFCLTPMLFAALIQLLSQSGRKT